MCLHFYLVLFEQVGYSMFLVQYRKVFSDQYNVSKYLFATTKKILLINFKIHVAKHLGHGFDIQTEWNEACIKN